MAFRASRFPLSAGDIRRRVTIRRKSLAQDATGQSVETWSDLLTTWADFEPLTVLEPYAPAGAGFAAFIDSLFRLRYRTDVTISPLDRLVCDGKTYDIVGVSEARYREMIEIKGYARAE